MSIDIIEHDMQTVELGHRNVVHGLEGCGKSSSVFFTLEKLATPERPVLFGFKTYELMEEQINTWSERFDIPKNQFAICGAGKNYFPAYQSYTNKENPGLIAPEVRFVLVTQAGMQRQHHLSFYSLATKATVKYSHIVQDEWSFTVGIIPSLDYEFNNIRPPKNAGISKEDYQKVKELEKLEWIEANYTKEDRNRVAAQKYLHDAGFCVATWIESCECPLTFLTSEVLATSLLEVIGFEKILLGDREFEDCTVNLWSSPLITRSFFNVMNQNVVWDSLSEKYGLIISDCVNSFFGGGESLNITVVTHASARGSNAYRDSNILTVISHIPAESIQMIRDSFEYYGQNFDFETIETLFYRDRLCQAIGRVIGYRGSKETDVIIHSLILEKIKTLNDFPYKLNTEWVFEFEDKQKVMSKVKEEKEKSKERKKTVRDTYKAKSYSYLDNIFEKDESSYIVVPEIKNRTCITTPATKIAKFFNLTIKNKRINGNSIRCIEGLRFKNV